MLAELRQIMNGPALRALMGLRDLGEAVLGFFNDPDGGDVADVDTDAGDIWCAVQGATSDPPTGKIVARLYIPMNAFFRLPKKGESCLVVRGQEADGPGKPYAFYGGGGTADDKSKVAPPGWLDASHSGLSVPEHLVIESTGDEVKITANTGGSSATIVLKKDGTVTIDAAGGKDIVLNGGTLQVARKTDKTIGDTTMLAWITAVSAKFNAAAGPMLSAPGTVTVPTDFGVINGGAANVKG